MDICRRNRADKEETVPINQCTQLVLVYFYSHHSRLIPAFCRESLCIRRTVREVNLLDRIAGSEQGEEERLVHPLSHNSR